MSELIALIATDVEATVEALKPLASTFEAERAVAEAERESKREAIATLKGLTAEELARLLAQIEPASSVRCDAPL